MLTIYHNPRCRKSREGLEILENSGQEFTVVKYLDTPLSKEELKDIVAKLGITPIDLVRKNETIWKEHYKGKDLTNDEALLAMVNNPKLIERPIVVHNDKAVVGRPPENIKSLLS